LNIILATTGWNIWNVIFDFTGGILSLLQLVLDSVDLHDLRHGILGNWAKLVLSLITLCFDTVFFCQHYMYSNEDENVNEEEVSNVYDLLVDGR
jgi:cystinosin